MHLIPNLLSICISEVWYFKSLFSDFSPADATTNYSRHNYVLSPQQLMLKAVFYKVG